MGRHLLAHISTSSQSRSRDRAREHAETLSLLLQFGPVQGQAHFGKCVDRYSAKPDGARVWAARPQRIGSAIYLQHRSTGVPVIHYVYNKPSFIMGGKGSGTF